jgi:N-acetylmuramate 1-kinase
VVDPTWNVLREIIGRLDTNAALAEPTPIAGGASVRRFFRVKLTHGSVVAMFMAGPLTHEIHKDPASNVAKRWPFLEVRDLLAERGIRVPAVHCDETSRGWLVVEDLGDDTVAKYLARRPEDRVAVYSRAVRDLAKAQRALSDLPRGCIVRKRAFDYDLLRGELDHFREWALEERGIRLSHSDGAAFESLAERLALRIASWPRGFVHRDYQSRNLMILPRTDRGREFDIAWIDFQDALLGPRAYDLVALLSDSYQTFSEDFVRARLDEYADEVGLDREGRAHLGREFDIISVQRKLKDAGRFVYIDRIHENPTFLGFVEPTIEKARAALRRMRDDDDMTELLAWLERVCPRPA